mmetsp:Transcript_2718/g.5978  ORF Transcript_2718/g.5978 Transcript_2718/m.5978 type:complete len:173 (-) Transcript_2718:61-579(-)
MPSFPVKFSSKVRLARSTEAAAITSENWRMDHDRKFDCLVTRPSEWLNEGSSNPNATEERLIPLGLDGKSSNRLARKLSESGLRVPKEVRPDPLSDFESESELLKRAMTAKGGAIRVAAEDITELRLLKSKTTVATMTRKHAFGSGFKIEVKGMSARLRTGCHGADPLLSRG